MRIHKFGDLFPGSIPRILIKGDTLVRGRIVVERKWQIIKQQLLESK
jgi:hypothetical protein